MGKVTIVKFEDMLRLLPHRGSALYIGPVKINWPEKKATAVLRMEPEHYAILVRDHFNAIAGHFYIEAINLVAAILALKLLRRGKSHRDSRIPVVGKTGEAKYPGRLASLQDAVVVEAQITRGPSDRGVNFSGQVYIVDAKGHKVSVLCKMVTDSFGTLINPDKISDSSGE